MQPRMTLARTLKLFKLPEQPQTPGLRLLTSQDVPQVHPFSAHLFLKVREHELWDMSELPCRELPQVQSIILRLISTFTSNRG